MRSRGRETYAGPGTDGKVIFPDRESAEAAAAARKAGTPVRVLSDRAGTLTLL